MITDEIRAQLAAGDPGLEKELLALMAAEGFRHLSTYRDELRPDSSDPRHCIFDFRHVTEFIFDIPGKALIVKLSLEESRGTERHNPDRQILRRWSLTFWLEFDPPAGTPNFGEVEPALTGNKFGQYGDSWMGYQLNWIVGEHRGGEVASPPAEVVSVTLGVVHPWRPHLLERFSGNLQVTSLPPINGRRPGAAFWDGFPIDELRAKVLGQIWGSDFE